jgi:hypothetical protein
LAIFLNIEDEERTIPDSFSCLYVSVAMSAWLAISNMHLYSQYARDRKSLQKMLLEAALLGGLKGSNTAVPLATVGKTNLAFEHLKYKSQQ